MFLVVQDEMQFQKICEHVQLENYVTIFYRGRRISRVSWAGVSNWLLFIVSFFKKKRPILVCEYANLVPRVIATLTASRIQSHYFGYVYESEIQPVLDSKKNFISKLTTPLYAEEFVIYGEHNPMLAFEDKFKERSINFVLGDKKLLSLPPVNMDSPYVAVVGQPIFELGREHLASCYHEAIDYVERLNLLRLSIFVTLARSKEILQTSEQISGRSKRTHRLYARKWTSLFCFAFDSSLIFELRFRRACHNFTDLLYSGCLAQPRKAFFPSWLSQRLNADE